MKKGNSLCRWVAAVLIVALFTVFAQESFVQLAHAAAGLFTDAEVIENTEGDPLDTDNNAQDTEGYYDIVGEDVSKRDAFTKHYILKDKSRISVVSAEPVHYATSKGWEDIDPSLTADASGTLQNTSGNYSVKFSDDIAANDAATIEYDGYTVSWSASGLQNGRKKAAVSNHGQLKKAGRIKKQNIGSTITSTAVYEDAYNNTDLEYQLAYNGIKENIIISKLQNKYEYSFIYNIDSRLSMRLLESGDVEVYTTKDNETVFVIPAPYMIDATGEVSYDAAYSLKTQGKNRYRLTVSANPDYINNAALPVTLDPAIFIKKVTEAGKIETSYLASGTSYANKTNLGADKKILYVGYESSTYKWCRTYIGVALPELTGSDIVTNAYIGMMQKQGRYNSTSIAEQAIGIAPVKNSWSASTLTWNMQSAYAFGNYLDYQYDVRNEKTVGSNTYYDIPLKWNVTSAVKQWYAADELTSCATGNTQNYGFVLRMVNESVSATSPAAHSIYYNDRTTTNYAPYIVIEYRNATGLESYWSYHGQAAGRAGTGQINDYTGNLVFSHADAATSGNRMPISISHIYNTYNANQEIDNIKCGKGWRLSIDQTISVSDSTIAANYPYYFTDADGTKHYFIKDGTVLKDEDGLGYELYVRTTGSYKYTLEDKSGNIMSFDTSGRLVKIQDTNKNYASIVYEANRILVTDGAGQQIIVAISGGRVSSITTPNGKSLTYTYNSAGFLTTITYPDSKQSTYVYDSVVSADLNARCLIRAQDPSGYAVHYEYTKNAARRVSRVYEKADGVNGMQMAITYGTDASTTYTTAGVDGVLSTTDDIITVQQYNNWGHTVSAYSHLANNVQSVVSAQCYSFDGTDYSTYNAANNRLTAVASGNVGADNLLAQPGFESMTGLTTQSDNTTTMFYLSSPNKLQGNYGGGIYNGTTTGGLSVYKQTHANAQNYSPLRSYTASVYVYTANVVGGNGGVVIGVCPGNKTFSEECYTVIPVSELSQEENGWSRISFTVTHEAATNLNENYSIYFGVYNLQGSVIFDCAQFEEGTVANEYSMVGVGRLHYSSNTPWTYSNMNTLFGMPTTYAYANGGFDKLCTASQVININENDTYTLSAWASAAQAIPALEKVRKAVYSSSSGYVATSTITPSFALKARVTYTDNTTKDFSYSYNTAVTGWQYGSLTFNTTNGTKTPKSITVILEYSNQIGTVYFKNVQMKLGSMTNYEYDSNGFVSNISDGKNAENTVVDSKGNVTKYTDINGQISNYTYNTNNLLTNSIILCSWIESYYVYDSYGNITSSSTFKDTFPAASHASEGRTFYIRSKDTAKLFLNAINTGEITNFTDKDTQLFTLEKCGDYWFIVANDGRVLGYDGMVASVPVIVLMDKATQAGAQQDKQLFTINSNAGNTNFNLKSMPAYYLAVVNNKLSAAKFSSPPFSGYGAWEFLDIQYYGRVETLYSSSEYASEGVQPIEPQENIKVRLRHQNSGFYLDSSLNSPKVVSYSDTDTQIFTLQKLGDYWYIVASNGQVVGYNGVMILPPVAELLNKATTAGIAQNQQLHNLTGSITQGYRLTSASNSIYALMPYTSKGQGAVYLTQTDRESMWDILPADSISSTAQYSPTGRFMTSSTDSRGNTTTYTYDSATGNLLSFTDSTGTTSYTYDENTGVMLSVTKSDKAAHYSYTDDQLASITRNGFTYTFEYDGFGNNIKTKVGNSILAQNTYNNTSGLLLGTTYGNGDSITFGYDNCGRVISSSAGGELKFSYTYDNGGRMLKSYDHENSKTYTFKYDLKGRLACKESSDGTRLKHTYDDRNYLLSYSRLVGGLEMQNTYTYGDGTKAKLYKSRVYGMTATNGANTVFTTGSAFDDLDRLSTRTLTSGSHTLTTGYAYQYGTALPTSITNNGSTISYTYDAAGNITTITDGSLVTYYAYDDLGQLIREDNAYANKTIAYAYDDGGNILSRTEYAYSPTTGLTALTITDTITYAYGNTDWKDQLTSFNGQAITYDEIGNPLSYRGMTISWQNGRQLATLAKDGLNAIYTYNDAGLRLSKTINGTTTQYYWNGTQLLAQKTGNSSHMQFLYDELGVLIGFNDGSKTYIYTRNLQGDILSITDSTNNAVVGTYTYDSWGNVLSATGEMANINPFRYRGYYFDAETSLYYLQSRYYDAQVGRFINADTLIFSGNLGANIYAYCANNPIICIDSNGQAMIKVFEKERVSQYDGDLLTAPFEEKKAEKFVRLKGKNGRKLTSMTDVDKRLAERIREMCQYYDIQALEITVGFRTRQDQQRRYDAFKNGTGHNAAKPGNSWHEFGGAIDIHNVFLEGLSNEDFERFGLIRDAKQKNGETEWWHVQIMETRGKKAATYGAEYFKNIERWGRNG